MPEIIVETRYNFTGPLKNRRLIPQGTHTYKPLYWQFTTLMYKRCCAKQEVTIYIVYNCLEGNLKLAFLESGFYTGGH